MTWNPFLLLHIRLVGSLRTLTVVVLIYLGLFLLGTTIARRAAGPGTAPGEISGYALIWVMGSQGLFLILLAAGAIRKAVLTDFQTGMIESHRLSPLSGARVVLGYMTGPPVQAVTLYLASLLLGSFYAADAAGYLKVSAGTVLSGWYGVQVCILSLAVLIWSCVLLAAIATGGKANIIGALVMMAIFGGTAIVPFIPGLAMVTGLLLGELVVRTLMARGALLSVAGTLSLESVLLQLAFSAVFLIAAARKVRSPERALFSVPMSLVLLTLTGIAAALGVSHAPQSQLAGGGSDVVNWQVLSSTLLFMMIGLFCLSAGATDQFLSHRAARYGEHIPRIHLQYHWLLPPTLLVMTLALLYAFFEFRAGSILSYSGEEANFRHVLAGGALPLSLLATFVMYYALLYIAKARGVRTIFPIALAVILLAIVPLMIDGSRVAYEQAMDPYSQAHFDKATGFSPVGTLIYAIWGYGAPWAGVAAQMFLAGLVAAWAMRTRNRVAAGTAASAVRPTPA